MPSYSFKGIQRTWTQRGEVDKSNILAGPEHRENDGPHTMIRVEKPQRTVYEEKWAMDKIGQLLRLYRVHRCLWDTSDPDNRNRKLRHAALVDITAALGKNSTLKQVVRKINVLRATYRYEKRRIKQRMRKGIGAKTRLKWFALADSFLRNVPKLERGKPKQIYDSDTDLEDVIVSTLETDSVPAIMSVGTMEVKVENQENARVREDLTVSSSTSVCFKKWSHNDSFRFVELIGEHPCLWTSAESSSKEQRSDAIEQIAKAMSKPVNSIEKRLETFKITCRKEKLRMSKDPDYKPQFVWWPKAERFMASEQVKPDINFIDASQLPPPTPLVAANLELKEEIEDVAYENHHHNVELSEEFVVAVGEEKPNSPGFLSQTEFQTPLPSQATKLIFNGLEDDLIDGKWSLKHSVKFLRLYGAHRCLWDLKHSDYRLRDLRQAAMSDIAAAMGYGLTAEHVAKKIKIFRITYMQHRKRMLESVKQGKEPKYQLRWYPLADSFLRPHIGLRSIKERESEVPQFDLQYVLANLNLIDPALLTDFRGKGTQNTICIGGEEIEQPFNEKEDVNFDESNALLSEAKEAGERDEVKDEVKNEEKDEGKVEVGAKFETEAAAKAEGEPME